MNYIQLNIFSSNAEILDIVIAELSLLGYDGFEESPSEIKTFIKENEFDENLIKELFQRYQLEYSSSIIQNQNWNQLWESNFQPVSIDAFVGIRAEFHQPFNNVLHEIIITPKMSFGTGHHATTYMMMQLMQWIDFKNKSVLDFGTGTGILAILAEKLDAAKILAIDYDEWCIENSLENIEKNGCKNIEILQSDTAQLNIKFDIIIANINRNIILDNLTYLLDNLVVGGILLLSGLLKDDEKEIRANCEQLGLRFNRSIDKDGWIALEFFHQISSIC